MIRNEYRERWARWLPSALEALAGDAPDFPAVMPAFPLPDIDRTAFTGPRSELRVALVSSSGAYDMCTQAPFASRSIVGDASHRSFESALPADRIAFAHEHYDRRAALRDAECVLPREALRRAGVTLTPHIVSWSGYLLDWPTFLEATIPQMLARVRADDANAAVIVPI